MLLVKREMEMIFGLHPRKQVVEVLQVILLTRLLAFTLGFQPLALELCPTGFFNFGDSLTDTGNAINAFPFTRDHESPPYGTQFFGKPSKRMSNGRLVPDFLSIAFGRKPLLQPNQQTGPYDYRFGVNFAFSGATATERSLATPFNFPQQINQFLRFKHNSEKVKNGCPQALENLPSQDIYENALYSILIGGNDLITMAKGSGRSWSVLNETITSAMNFIASRVKDLILSGARRFLIFQLPNAGCCTVMVSLLESTLEKDRMGCIKLVNTYDLAYNSALRQTVELLRSQFPRAQLDIFNYYSANEEILRNPGRYGFNPEKIFTACCGDPTAGTYNYNPSVRCGNPKTTMCSNPDEYVNWDGVHFTEQFYRTIARFILEGNFTDLGINYTSLCGVEYSLFASSVRYTDVYPNSCTSSPNRTTPTLHQSV